MFFKNMIDTQITLRLADENFGDVSFVWGRPGP